jgi:phenylacetate-CoA ligase
MLREIQGRSTDFVVAEDGTVMHGLALIYILRDLPQIASFKIIQESRRRVRVQVVSETPLADDVAARIRSGFKGRLGAGVDVVIDLVAAIPPERSGKFRYVVSQVVP